MRLLFVCQDAWYAVEPDGSGHHVLSRIVGNAREILFSGCTPVNGWVSDADVVNAYPRRELKPYGEIQASGWIPFAQSPFLAGCRTVFSVPGNIVFILPPALMVCPIGNSMGGPAGVRLLFRDGTVYFVQLLDIVLHEYGVSCWESHQLIHLDTYQLVGSGLPESIYAACGIDPSMADPSHALTGKGFDPRVQLEYPRQFQLGFNVVFSGEPSGHRPIVLPELIRADPWDVRYPSG